MADPPPNPNAPPLRRIAAGDWVVARNAAAKVSPGLGKLTGGDYDGETLIHARIEFPSGVREAAAGDMARVLPEQEADVVEYALKSGLVPTPDRAALQTSLDRFRAGEQQFVRTPGLLDQLWVVHRRAQPERAGLAALFEADWDELWRIVHQRFTPPPREPRPRSVPEEDDDEYEPSNPFEYLPQDSLPSPSDQIARNRAAALAGDWWGFERLRMLDSEAALTYLRDHVENRDLKLAARFGCQSAATAGGFPLGEPPQALRDANPMAAFGVLSCPTPPSEEDLKAAESFKEWVEPLLDMGFVPQIVSTPMLATGVKLGLAKHEAAEILLQLAKTHGVTLQLDLEGTDPSKGDAGLEWEAALAYLCAALAGLVDAWLPFGAVYFVGANELRPALRGVADWLSGDPTFQASLRTLGFAEQAVWQAELFNKWAGSGAADLAIAAGALAYACAPKISSCGLPGAPDPDEEPGRLPRLLYARERLLAAITSHSLAKLSAAGVQSEAFAETYEAVLTRLEQRANRALIRWLLTRSLFVD